MKRTKKNRVVKKRHSLKGKPKRHIKKKSITRKPAKHISHKKGVKGMEGKKRHHTKKRSMHGKAKRAGTSIKHMDYSIPKQIVFTGKRHAKKLHHKGRLLGGSAGSLVKRAGGSTINIAAGVAGGIAGAYLVNVIPGTNQKLKVSLPLIAGIFLASMARVPALQAAGMGMGITGGLALLRSFVPSLPVLPSGLAGNSPVALSPVDMARLGIPVRTDLGIPVETALGDMDGLSEGYIVQD